MLINLNKDLSSYVNTTKKKLYMCQSYKVCAIVIYAEKLRL